MWSIVPLNLKWNTIVSGTPLYKLIITSVLIVLVWLAFLKAVATKHPEWASIAAASAVQASRSATSSSLWPHGPQHTRPPCPSPAPGVYSNSCPLSWWCHPTILSSVVLFSSCLQSFPASGSFQMSQLFASGGQSIGVSVFSIPVNTQDWFPLG